MRVWVLVAVLWISGADASQASGCGGPVPCDLGGRSYHIRLPDDWDGKTAMPLLLHFHGWQRTGALPVAHRRISGATRRRGVLLVAPNGENRTWNFWRVDSADVSFAMAVIADVARRFPIDAERIMLSGYSYGALMASRVACEEGHGIDALLAISGILPHDSPCPEAPREIRHVHGLADTVLRFPPEAREDKGQAVGLWRDALGCAPHGQRSPDWHVVSFLTFSRQVWTACETGRAVVLDTHPGGHFIPHGWIGRQLDEILGRAPTYP